MEASSGVSWSEELLALVMEQSRSLYFNAPGLTSHEFEIAPETDTASNKSKRQPLIENEDTSLDLNIRELDEGTRARNRAFQERLDKVWRRTSAWEEKLRQEGKEAVETILNMKDQYRGYLDTFKISLKEEIQVIFDKFDEERIPLEISRVDEIEKDLTVFIKETVPTTIEKQSGEVSRQLKRAYETFDIEKKKEEKR